MIKNLIFKVIISIIGVLFCKFMLGSVLNSIQKKKDFNSEYLDVLNNPNYRVKRSCE